MILKNYKIVQSEIYKSENIKVARLRFSFDKAWPFVYYKNVSGGHLTRRKNIKMTKLVYDEWGGLDGRTLTDEEYNNLTVEELLVAIYHSFGVLALEQDNDCRFTQRVREELEMKSAEELKELIRENDGLIIRLSEPDHRYVFPEFSKGPRKGHLNFKKEPEVFIDRWYHIENKEDCVLK